MLFTETFTFSLQVDFDDVAAINPELLQLLPLPEGQSSLQKCNCSGSCQSSDFSQCTEDALGLFGSLLVCFLGLT